MPLDGIIIGFVEVSVRKMTETGRKLTYAVNLKLLTANIFQSTLNGKKPYFSGGSLTGFELEI